MATRVRSWTPLEGPFHDFLVTHGESISIADHLTLRKSGAVVYRPTVHYAYHPCDDAVLLMGHAGGVYWFGSRLSIEQARSLAPFNSATSLQVAAGVLAGMVWVLAHPQAGVIEPDDMDTEDPWQFKNVRVL
jgi:homospermidine synthase